MRAVPFAVSADPRGRPLRFQHRRRSLQVVEVLDAWEEAGCWWQGEEPRRLYRVLTDSGAVYELQHQADAGWQLMRVLD